MKEKVVIIGAGPSGLAAAHRILSEGADRFDVTILEVSDRIGGISATVEYDGNRMDLGGHRFFTKSDEVRKWWESLLPVESPNVIPDKTERIMLCRDRLSRIFFRDSLFDYPVSLSFSTLRKLGLSTSLAIVFSYLKSLVFRRKEKSLEDFYINRFGKKLYSIFFEYYTEKLWGIHPDKIAPDWGYQRVKGVSIINVIKDRILKDPKEKETSLIERFYYPKLGCGQLWECAADDIIKMGGRILKNAKAEQLKEKDGRLCAVRYMSDGLQIDAEADYIVSSMPLKELIAGIPDAYDKAAKCAEGLIYRDMIVIGMLIPVSAIRLMEGKGENTSLPKDNWIYVQEKNVKLGRIQLFNNWSPYLVRDSENTMWLGLEYFCNEGDELWEAADERLAELALKELTEIGFLKKEGQMSGFHVERVKKAYPCYFGGFSEINAVREYVDKIPNLLCIGRNGQHRYNNMDHSVLTGFEAADYILGKKSSKDAIWNINTEKTYNES